MQIKGLDEECYRAKEKSIRSSSEGYKQLKTVCATRFVSGGNFWNFLDFFVES
jgi:hypothetical protein